MIERPYYLECLQRWKDKNMIKVLTGLRRSGKSTIMEMFQKQLESLGVAKTNIICLNFENLDDDLPHAYKELYRYVVARLASGGMNYVFLDEVQNVREFEKAVNALHKMADVDLYITGSNAYMLSGELVTHLTGRYIEIKVQPLSFKEYLSGHQTAMNLAETKPKGIPWSRIESRQNIPESYNQEQVFDRYLTYGGLPMVEALPDELTIKDYLSGVFGTIVLKNIAQRRPRMDMLAFQSTAAFVADNVGNISSIKRISDILSAQGLKIAQGTVNEYLEALTENYLLHKVKRFDLRGKQHLKTLEKYYLGDMGIRFWLLGKKAGDLGHRLENIVYLELCRRYTNVFIGKEGEHEVDFVAMDEQGHHYFQVCQTVMDESTLARELKPLQSIKDNYPKVLLSMDTIGTGDHAGITHLNLIDWLLE